MQIDFHHGTTYILARLAGFNQKDASIVAHAAQYVDDATSSGTVYFDNRAVYHRISSAHKMLDPKNVLALSNHMVWLPFHFLPGNDGFKAGNDHSEKFIRKIVCKPNSYVAQDIVLQAILEQDAPYGLHRLGVTMHVYADTWAHQGFAGVLHRINEVDDIEETGRSGVFSFWDRLKESAGEAAIPPLGHGRAGVFPDMPFLSWQYKNGEGDLIQRNNTEIFCDAAKHLYIAMKRYIARDPDASVEDMSAQNMQMLREMFANTKDEDGEKRHEAWLEAIEDGKFSVGKGEQVTYAARGKGSWKQDALNTSFDQPVHEYREDFLESNWKLFHDAVQAHRFYVVHNILPKYGICAA